MFAAISQSGVRRWAYTMGLGALLLALFAPTLAAGTLLTLPGSMPEFTGYERNLVAYDAEYDYYSYTVNLEYAVFKDSVPGLPLSYPGKYIYTYQFFNHHQSNDPDTLSDGGSNDPITTFDVGLLSNNIYDAGSGPVAGSVADPSPTDPTSRAPSSITITSNSLHWNFDYDPYTVYPGEQSDILYFVTPYSPYLTNASFSGNVGLNIDGVPVPEPATGMLAIIAALALLSTGVVRRVRGKNRAS